MCLIKCVIANHDMYLIANHDMYLIDKLLSATSNTKGKT